VTDLVGHVSDRPARDRRAPLLILRKKELSYEQRSGAINKKEEQIGWSWMLRRFQILILIFELSLSFESRSFEIKIRVGIL
jgi:hypothetical protein